MSYLTRAFGAVKLFSKAHAPTIMVCTGVASMTAGAVVGAKKTLQVEEVLAKHTPDLEKIKIATEGLMIASQKFAQQLYEQAATDRQTHPSR